MYINIGSDKSILKSEIIGIFDIDKTTVKKDSRNFLNSAEKNSEAITISMEDMPLSFIVCSENKKEKKSKQKIYISPVSVNTLNQRFSGNKK